VGCHTRSRDFSQSTRHGSPSPSCLLTRPTHPLHRLHSSLRLTYSTATSTSTPSRVAWSTPTTRSKRINYFRRGSFFLFSCQHSKGSASNCKTSHLSLFLSALIKIVHFIVLCVSHHLACLSVDSDGTRLCFLTVWLYRENDEDDLGSTW
jgi:hypothetical protein